MSNRQTLFLASLFALFAWLLSCQYSPATACGKHQKIEGKLLEITTVFALAEGKPLDVAFARKRALAGSPLVVQTDSGEVYFPIPVKHTVRKQTTQLIKLLGKRVAVEGDVFQKNNMLVVAPNSIEACR